MGMIPMNKNSNSIKKDIEEDDLRPEYDLAELLKKGIRGKYIERFRAGTNLVLLEPDIARVFPNDQAVNEALCLIFELTKIVKQNYE